MPEIGGVDLSKKIGPVPIWMIAVGGGLALAWFVNRNLSSSGGTGDVSATPTVESGVGGTPGGFIPAPTPDTTVSLGPLDNEQWAVKAVGWLVGNGYNALEAGIAVRKYLDGEQISSAQLTMITVVTRAIGVPPNIPVGGGVITTPTTVAALPAPTGFRITGVGYYQEDFVWNAVAGASFYEIESTSSPTGIRIFYGTSASIFPLFKGTVYRWHIRTVNSAGVRGPWSTIIQGTTKG